MSHLPSPRNFRAATLPHPQGGFASDWLPTEAMEGGGEAWLCQNPTTGKAYAIWLPVL